MKKHVIITSCDEKHGDFVIKHWLKSLQTNVQLNDIDIIVIGYHLRPDQKRALLKNKVILVLRRKNGHIVTSRFIDAREILKYTHYDQVLFADGGDIIFQKDISPLFTQYKDEFRAIKQDHDGMFYEFFKSSMEPKIYKLLKHKPVYNAGFVLAPRKKFLLLCSTIARYTKDKRVYGPDQVIMNYFFNKMGVITLDQTYNFNINNTKKRFSIRRGLFYLRNNRLVHVVHNSGRLVAWRPILNFGYGKGYNSTNYFIYYLRKLFYSITTLFKKSSLQTKDFSVN